MTIVSDMQDFPFRCEHADVRANILILFTQKILTLRRDGIEISSGRKTFSIARRT